MRPMLLSDLIGYYPDNCCQVCGWSLASDRTQGCFRSEVTLDGKPTWWHDCSYRPPEGSADAKAQQIRRVWLERHPWFSGAALRTPPPRPFVKSSAKERLRKNLGDLGNRELEGVDQVVDLVWGMTLREHLFIWFMVKFLKFCDYLERKTNK